VATRNEVFIKGTEPLPSSQGETSEGTRAAELSAQADSEGHLLAASQIAQPLGGDGTTLATPNSPGPGENLRPENDASTTPSPDGTRWGQLHIESDPPGLEVFVDGRSVGLSPVTLTTSVGQHNCRVAPPPGRTSAESTIRVTASAVATLNVRY
jgi:hypothetical protein